MGFSEGFRQWRNASSTLYYPGSDTPPNESIAKLHQVDFKKIEYPGTGIAKSYSSDVNLIEDKLSRRVLIQMNER